MKVIVFTDDFHVTDLGVRQPRLEGEEYLSIVDEFMEAVHARWPKAIVQVCISLRTCCS
jgi:malate dehydrogenase (decarboxylating)